MAKIKKATTVQKIVIVGLVLILVQAGYLFIFANNAAPVAFMDLVNQNVEQIPGLDAQGKAAAKVEMALMDFIGFNHGKPPTSLDDLVPKYFDRIPVDPSTNKPFLYKVEGNRYVLGTPRTTALAANQSSGGSPSAPLTQEQADQLLLASVTGGLGVDLSYVYDSSGKRDPFQPFDIAPKGAGDTSKSPLERVTFSQMKVTAVLGGVDEPTAIVELEGGRGYPVKKGTKIGPNGGAVAEILPNKVVIIENIVDFTGETKSNTVELVLRNKNNNDR